MQTVDPQTMALATALLGFLSSIITQVAKRWISKDYRAVFALIVSLIVSALAVGVNVLTTMTGRLWLQPSWVWLVYLRPSMLPSISWQTLTRRTMTFTSPTTITSLTAISDRVEIQHDP